ncbi:MAG: hypothetical protein NTY53_23505, partial [Kiritimatiellaeota bacterium]|nr:hypothetical protein [Kiritimatiellota bacterium]
FSAYTDGALPAKSWDALSGTWRVTNKQFTATTSYGLCQWRKAPELETLDFSAQLVVTPGPASKDWKTAGAAIILDGRNHWRLNLVEGPDGKRYTEFGETSAGTWQAQRAAGTQLRILKSVMGAWNFGVAYRLRITLSEQEISGEISEVAGGKIIAAYRYAWNGVEGVKFGRPGFSANGLTLAVSSASVTASRTPTAASMPAIENGTAGRVALITDLPGFEHANLDAIAAALRRAGFGVTQLTGTELASPALFSSLNFHAVVLPGSRYFPTKARDNFLRFLRNGGHCVVLGGNVFEEPLTQLGGRWYSRSDVERELAATKPETRLLDPAKMDARTWYRGTDSPKARSVATVEGQSLRFDIKALKGWDTFNTKISAPPPGQSLLCFRAKGDATTPQVTVEVDELDGTRWISIVDLTTEWKSYALSPDRFEQWEAKGVKKNLFTPANAVKLSFGLAINFNANGAKGDHTFWVEAVGMASNRLGRIDLSRTVELNMLYDYEPYHLTNVVAVGAAPGRRGRLCVPQRIEVHPAALDVRSIWPRLWLGRGHAHQLRRGLSRLVVDLLRHHESEFLRRARRARYARRRAEGGTRQARGDGARREHARQTGGAQGHDARAAGLHPPQRRRQTSRLSRRPPLLHERLQLHRPFRSLRRTPVARRLLQRRRRRGGFPQGARRRTQLHALLGLRY